ncbi:MAG: DUF362 domain-containing protein [Candidatus Thorarchaeota archaeon]
MDSVALVDVEEDITKPLETGLNLIGGFGTPNSPVIIKPNICTITDNTGYSVTHSFVIEILLELLYEQDPNLSIRIVESDSQSKWANEAFTKFGYTELAAKFKKRNYDIELVNLSESVTAPVSFKGDYFTDPKIPNILTKARYVISVAQAKTHYLTSITGVLKNLFGFLPRKTQNYYHPNINEVIVDLNRLIPIDLSIIDARIGVEGWNGPKTIPLNKFVLGHKPVSVDSVLAQLMNCEPTQIQHLVQCEKYGLGTLTPQIIRPPESDKNG